jgi:hypothetical protein
MSKRLTALPLFPVEPPQGFDAAKLRSVNANGSALHPSGESPATVPVPLPVILADVIGKYTERDRKLWRFLLHAAWDNLETKRIHEISVREIGAVFEQLSGSKDYSWIMESARRLSKTRVEYKITCGDPRFDVRKEEAGEGFAVFLSAARRTEMGTLLFEIPAMLIDIIKKPLRFARVRTHFIIGLSGKHAVTIYEILEAFANKKDPSFVVSVAEFRQWLNLKPTEYARWDNLKAWVINPALVQINENPQGAGFSVTMETVKRGRDITHLRFVLTKTAERTASDEMAQAVSETNRFAAKHPEHPRLKASTRSQAARLFPRADIRECERDWLGTWEKRGKVKLADPDRAFLHYLPKWAKLRDLA